MRGSNRDGKDAVAAARIAITVLLIAACGSWSGRAGTRGSPEPTGSCRNFGLSLVSNSGGQVSPLTAARWFALHGGIDVPLPSSGWMEQGHDSIGVILRSGTATVHAVQGSDRTWQVDCGKAC